MESQCSFNLYLSDTYWCSEHSEEHNVSTCELLIRELVSFWERYVCVCVYLTLEDFGRAISMLRTNHFPRLVSTLNLHYALEWVQGWWIWAHVTYTECGPQKWAALPFGSCSCLAWLWDDIKIAYAWFQERQSWLPRELRFSSQELCAEFITWWPLFRLHTALAVHWLLRVSPAMLSSLPRSASLNPEPLHSFCLPTVTRLLLLRSASCSNWDA